MPFWEPHFGYQPEPEKTAAYVASLQYPRLAFDLPHLMRQRQERDVFLWEPLLTIKPSWKRGAQAIGDCVSWGAELVCTMLMAMQAVKGESSWIEEAATESIYGMRCEVDKQFCNTQDGWYGSGAAEALQTFGVLCRIDYSRETGNSEHDLQVYDGRKAKHWGQYGCGGKNDNGKLDTLAKKYPAKGVTQVRSVEESAAAIDAGCPITIASGVGFGEMKRNSDGIVRRSGSWAHQMMLGGIRYKSGEPQFRIFQSWGKSCSGPDPGIDKQVISDCSWWAVAEDIEKILREDDSFAFSRVEGFAQPPWEFTADDLFI